ncbi:glycoside hydrolase family 88/105 protein [Qingshengfaniella alkalisoli]|uniref:Di-trans,poly-cis-decaprenylcistransferase n=1 Tax=Qingshengfaniella alkalisoli TaxID=2599296 RepID=A0A5B8J249_9RHOB|nr:glycoside hydrolase family 88 protein [Qingshengfaniella alkalisoli]QDY70868.1 di-trans,poly-cis-decaprenylcistransferase [Qingshengfaniella alkalisoli]
MTPLEYFDGYARDYRYYKGGSWCYEDGCVYRGLESLSKATGNQRWLDHLLRLTDGQIAANGSLDGYSVDEFNIDHILAGRVLFFLLEQTGDQKYRKAADLLASQLASHPRTDAGNYWHKKRYPWQVWLDGLYMGLPFQIEYGQLTDNDALIDDAIAQLVRALDLTSTGQGLYAHGYDESRDQGWSDRVSGLSASHWARAIGWLAMALVDCCALIGSERAVRSGLQGRATGLLDEIVGLRTSGGLWLQVIDQPDLESNYVETSASAMFAYALQRADRDGLRRDTEGAGSRALEEIEARYLSRDKSSDVLAMKNICLVGGLGGFSGVYRDGTPEYYLSEPIVSDDSKGVGPLMMAHAEWLIANASNRITTAAQ